MAVTPPPADDSALTAAALAGDEEALGRLLGMHQQTAYNVAYRLLGSEADARDAVQEAFLRAVRAVRGEGARPREADRFPAWLRRVVANAAMDQLRARPSLRQVTVDVVAEVLPGPDRTEPARAVERREARGDVLKALLSLPDAQRAALTLREYEELPYADIAAELGVTHSAVETLLFRARREFRAAYEGIAAAPGPVGCEELGHLLAAAADDELSAAGWRELDAHLERCPHCRQELDQTRRSRRLYALIPLLSLPALKEWNPVAQALTAAGHAGAAHAAGGLTASAATAGPPAATIGTTTATSAAGGGLVAKLAGLSGAKAAALVAAAGLGVAAVATPLVTTNARPEATPTLVGGPATSVPAVASPAAGSPAAPAASPAAPSAPSPATSVSAPAASPAAPLTATTPTPAPRPPAEASPAATPVP